MHVRAFAEIDDYVARYGEVDDVVALSAVLEDASRVIASELDAHGIDWRDPDDEYADKLMSVCRNMAYRALDAETSDATIPIGATQYSLSAAGFTEYAGFNTKGSGYGEVYLTRAERRMLGIRQSVTFISPVGGGRHARR